MFDATNTKDWQQSGNGVFLLREIPGQWVGTGPDRRSATENEFALSVHHTDRDRLIETVIAGKITDALNGPKWQDEPTPGDWWLSVSPAQRGRVAWDTTKILECRMVGTQIEVESRTGSRISTKRFHLSDELLSGARWLKRETPTDPFARGG